MKWLITYYTLSDCTAERTVTAESEAEARQIVMQNGECEMIVSVSRVAQPELEPVLIYERRQKLLRGQFCEHGTYLTLCPECSDLA